MENSKTFSFKWRPLATPWRHLSAQSVACLETVVLSALGPILGSGLHPSDPLFRAADFPWFVLVPLLIGLRHGLSCSLGSSTILGVAAVTAWQLGLPSGAGFPGDYLAGMLAVSLIGSEYRGHWHRTLEQLSGRENYHRLRLEQFAKTYHILKSSHDSLEQQISANTRSLRGALSDLEKQMLSLDAEPGQPFCGVAGGILQLFSDYGMLQIAALWGTAPDGAIASVPVATLGAPRSLRRDDPVLLAALELKCAVAVSPAQTVSDNGILAAVPLIDVAGHIHGVVTVDELPFVALQRSNLNLLSAFGGYIADCLTAWRSDAGPSDPTYGSFRDAVQRAVVNARNCRIPAMMVGLSLSAGRARPEFIDHVVLNCRGLDRVWVGDRGKNGVVVLKLMPCTDQMGAERYIWRLDRLLKNHWGVALSSDGVRIGIESITGQGSAEQVLGKFKRLLKPAAGENQDAWPDAEVLEMQEEARWSSQLL